MPTIGCKSCGRRKKKDLVNEIVISEPTKPKYVINKVEEKQNFIDFDWKSMSKMI